MSGFVNVELVCNRQDHKDTMYGTDIVWAKRGAVRRVPEDAWLKMKIHADVYKLVGDREPDMLSLATAEVVKAAAVGVDKVVVVSHNAPVVDTSGPWTEDRVAAASDEELRAVAAALGQPMHPRLKDPEKVRKAFMLVVNQVAAETETGEPS